MPHQHSCYATYSRVADGPGSPQRRFKVTEGSQMAAEPSGKEKNKCVHVPYMCGGKKNMFVLHILVGRDLSTPVMGAVTGSVSLVWQLGCDTTREFHKVPKFSVRGHSFSLCNALLKRQISCGQTLHCPFALCLPLFMLIFGLMCRREICFSDNFIYV